jgi:uncharacterized membrane protein YeiH
MLWNPTALQTLASAGVTGPLWVEFTIPVYLDYFATFAWALSGAVVGVQRRYDIVGVFVIALVLSTGGGLLRDGFLLQRTPVFLSNGDYLVLITLATAVIAVATRWLMLAPKVPWSDKLIDFIDAFGVPAFAVIGMQLALDQGLPIPGVLLVGVINGVGGLLLRDLLANETPRLLLPGQYYADSRPRLGGDTRGVRHGGLVLRHSGSYPSLQLADLPVAAPTPEMRYQ